MLMLLAELVQQTDEGYSKNSLIVEQENCFWEAVPVSAGVGFFMALSPLPEGRFY